MEYFTKAVAIEKLRSIKNTNDLREYVEAKLEFFDKTAFPYLPNGGDDDLLFDFVLICPDIQFTFKEFRYHDRIPPAELERMRKTVIEISKVKPGDWSKEEYDDLMLYCDKLLELIFIMEENGKIRR